MGKGKKRGDNCYSVSSQVLGYVESQILGTLPLETSCLRLNSGQPPPPAQASIQALLVGLLVGPPGRHIAIDPLQHAQNIRYNSPISCQSRNVG